MKSRHARSKFNFKLQRVLFFFLSSLVMGCDFLSPIVDDLKSEYRIRWQCRKTEQTLSNLFGAAQVCLTEVVYLEENGTYRLSENEDMITYFHGATGDAKDWSQYHETLYSAFHHMGIDAPRVLSLSWGGFWILVEESDLEFGLLTKTSESLKNEISSWTLRPDQWEWDPDQWEFDSPADVNELGARPFFNIQGRQFLFGRSMGGFNAAVTSLRRPNDYDAVILHCPALFDFHPRLASDQEVLDWMLDRVPFDFETVYLIHTAITGRLLRSDALRGSNFADYFSTEESWLQHSPLDLARSQQNQWNTDFLVIPNERDEFAFFEDSVEFLERLRRSPGAGNHQTLSLKVAAGRHCELGREFGNEVVNFLYSSSNLSNPGK